MSDGPATTPAEAPAAVRFVWPPRPVALEALDAPGASAARSPTPPPSPPPDRTPGAAAPPAPPRSVWAEVERTWLSLACPPWPRRAAEAGWAPDGPGVYCARCGTTVGPHDGDASGCQACRGRRLPWERFIRLGPYEGLLREAILEVKFTRWRRLGDDLGVLLGRAVLEALAAAGEDPVRALIVPVPTTFRRRVSRGIDHALVIARGVSRATGLPLVRALERRHRPSQLSVAPSRRAANVAGSMRRRPRVDLGSRLAIVVDDVRTTGATMSAACRALLKGPAGRGQPAGCWAAVVGVTPRPGTPQRTLPEAEASG